MRISLSSFDRRGVVRECGKSIDGYNKIIPSAPRNPSPPFQDAVVHHFSMRSRLLHGEVYLGLLVLPFRRWLHLVARNRCGRPRCVLMSPGRGPSTFQLVAWGSVDEPLSVCTYGGPYSAGVQWRMHTPVCSLRGYLCIRWTRSLVVLDGCAPLPLSWRQRRDRRETIP